jgi:two-component system cell cycle sensor histidine kinase/response regulator CckA
LLERHDPPVHSMLTDVVMPGISGPDLAARLSETRPELKILYTSGHTEIATLPRSLLDNAIHFIGKPYTRVELTRIVRQTLDSGFDGPVSSGAVRGHTLHG